MLIYYSTGEEDKKILCSYQIIQSVWLHTKSWKKTFCHYCLQGYRTAETLRCHMKYCFKISGKQRIKIPKQMQIS